MIIAGVDTETTGVKLEKGDRIIEICIGLYELDDQGVLTHLGTTTQRINPLRAIAVAAQRVHGIALEDLRTMPTWAEYADEVNDVLSKVDLVVAHNAPFDTAFIEAEQRTVGKPLTKPIKAFCTMENARWATFDGKRPSLRELCWCLGVEYDPTAAHAADYDVDRTMECFSKGLRLGFFKLENKGDENGDK